MADWKTKVRLGDLHEAHQNGTMKIGDVARTLAKRLRRNRYAKDLERLIAKLEVVKNANSYDTCLAMLYDFGDEGHRIWIDSSRGPP